MKKQSQLSNFESAMNKILTESREDLGKRETKWKEEREKKKRAKTSPASRVVNGPV